MELFGNSKEIIKFYIKEEIIKKTILKDNKKAKDGDVKESIDNETQYEDANLL